MKRLYNGVEIPEIGYGTFPSKDELVTNIPIAWKHGYRLIDTSEDYFNMEYIGVSIKEYPQLQNLFVISKISWPNEIFNMKNIVDGYKKELQLERPIDCLLLHFPSPHTYLDMWHELEHIYESGMCRAIGVCNFEIKHLEKLINHSKIKPMINQIELHPTFQQKELCEYCKKNEIVVMAYSPLARMADVLTEDNRMIDISTKYHKTVQQIILRWDIQKGFIPLPASKNEEHIASNIDIFDFELTDEEIRSIDSLECGNRIRYTADTFYNKKQRWQFLKMHVKYRIKKAIKYMG